MCRPRANGHNAVHRYVHLRPTEMNGSSTYLTICLFAYSITLIDHNFGKKSCIHKAMDTSVFLLDSGSTKIPRFFLELPFVQNDNLGVIWYFQELHKWTSITLFVSNPVKRN